MMNEVLFVMIPTNFFCFLKIGNMQPIRHELRNSFNDEIAAWSLSTARGEVTETIGIPFHAGHVLDVTNLG